MRKSIVLMLIATLLVGALMVSCNSDVSEGTNGGDKLVEVTISGGSTSKGISAVGSMEDADAYYWYYKAGKNDSSVYRTGETVAVSNGVLGEGGWKPVKTNGNNEAVVGLKNSNLGYFSTGDWLFSFVAYKKAATFTANSDSATNNNVELKPVYYQYNLAVEVSTSTIATDQKVYITVTPNVGQAQGDAEFVFPEEGLTWKYKNDTSADEQYTLTALDGKKAYMYVYYKDNSVTDYAEHLLARSDEATITSDTTNKESNGTFTGFKGVDTNSEFTKDPVTIASTYSGKNYTLYFRVVLSSNSEEIGWTNTQSVTAYTGGKITISSTGTASVYDNEVQYEVVISDIDAVAVSETKSTATVLAPVASEEAGSTNSDKKTITTSVTAVSEQSSNEKSTIVIPTAALAPTTKTVTQENDTTTTTVVSSTHEVSTEIKTDSATLGTFNVTDGNTAVASLQYIVTKTTTTEVTVKEGEETITQTSETSAPAQVDTFFDKYLTCSTYITKHLTDVAVVYNGEGEAPRFDSTNFSPSVAVASTFDDNRLDGTGYNPETGLIVFKTKHFSTFVVTSADVAKVDESEGYPTLAGAFAAANAKGSAATVKLLRNVVVMDQLNITGSDVTLDLNGKTISHDLSEQIQGGLIMIHRGAKLTLDDTSTNHEGKIDASCSSVNPSNGYPMLWGGIQLTHKDDSGDAAAKLVVNNGTIEAEFYAVTGNGSRHNTEITVSGGSLIAKQGTAIYHPQDGTMIISGGSLNGTESAVEIRSGILTVSGGIFVATDTPITVNSNGNGTTSSGSAIAIAQHTTKKAISVTVTGGEFTGYSAFFQSDPERVFNSQNAGNVTLNISGGKFTCNSANDSVVSSENLSGFISGGDFSKEPAVNYIADGYEVVGDSEFEGYYKVQSSETPVATVTRQIGDNPAEIRSFYSSSYAEEAENSDITADFLAFDYAMKYAINEKSAKSTLVLNKDIEDYYEPYLYGVYGVEIADIFLDDHFVSIGAKETDKSSAIVDLNSHTITFGYGGLLFYNTDVTIKNGTINASHTSSEHASALFSYGNGHIVIENCNVYEPTDCDSVYCAGDSAVLLYDMDNNVTYQTENMDHWEYSQGEITIVSGSFSYDSKYCTVDQFKERFNVPSGKTVTMTTYDNPVKETYRIFVVE